MPALQSLRFLFVFLIFLSHVPTQGTQVAAGTFDCGADGGVAFFFILSGFVLSLSYGCRIDNGTFSMRKFLAGRLHKFYPLHLLCLAVWLLLHVMSTESLAWRPLVANVLLVQSWIPSASYYFSGNAVSWFLSTLLACYVFFPVLYRLFMRSRKAVAASAGVILLAAYALLLLRASDVNAYVYVAPYSRVVDFALGILLARIYRHATFHASALHFATSVVRVWAVRLLSLGLMATSLLAYNAVPMAVRTCCLFWPAALLLILSFAVEPSPAEGTLRPTFVQRVLRWLGGVSFAFFMVHQLVLAVLGKLWHVVPSPMPFALIATAATLLSLALAYAWHRAAASVLIPHSTTHSS